jgi:hypothetical protein
MRIAVQGSTLFHGKSSVSNVWIHTLLSDVWIQTLGMIQAEDVDLRCSVRLAAPAERFRGFGLRNHTRRA